MQAYAQKIMLSDGWSRRLIAFVAGAAGALAMAPLFFLPGLVVTMVVAVWLLDGAAQSMLSDPTGLPSRGGWRMAFADGWWLGFGYFVAGLWWLGAAFLVQAAQFAWALPLGVLALPAGLALFTGFGFVVARALWMPGAGRILALATALTLSEWLRGHLFSGFPWNDFGMGFGGILLLAQPAALFGLYGLTPLVVAICASPATLVDGGKRARLAPLVGLAALVIIAGFGALRLNFGHVGHVAHVRLRLVQPNQPNDASFSAENGNKILSDYLKLSDEAISPGHSGLVDETHVIWPESPFPFILSRDAPALSRIGATLPIGTTLITGAARLGATADHAGRHAVYNSMQVIGHGGTILGTYDKVHLVPFGEYLPFAWLIRHLGLRQFAHSSFTPGHSHALLHVPGLPPVAPLICYEAIFSGAVTPAEFRSGEPRPGLLLNITDDSWFGQTPGPAQHLAQARLRAIEEGLPLVRDADSGISAVVDPYGRIMAELPLGEQGVLDARLPMALPTTPFSRFPVSLSLTVWIISLFSTLLWRFRI